MRYPAKTSNSGRSPRFAACVAAVLFGLGVTAALPARAAPQTDSGGTPVKQAKAHFDKGSQHYRDGQYREALRSFEKALSFTRRSSIVLNLAQCHRQLGHPAEAVRHYRDYLDLWQKENSKEPRERAPYYEEVQKHILELSVHEEKSPEKVAAAPMEQPRPAPRPARVSTPIYKKWWFWTIVGAVAVGAAAAGTAVALQPSPAEPVQGSLAPGVLRLP